MMTFAGVICHDYNKCLCMWFIMLSASVTEARTCPTEGGKDKTFKTLLLPKSKRFIFQFKAHIKKHVPLAVVHEISLKNEHV